MLITFQIGISRPDITTFRRSEFIPDVVLQAEHQTTSGEEPFLLQFNLVKADGIQEIHDFEPRAEQPVSSRAKNPVSSTNTGGPTELVAGETIQVRLVFLAPELTLAAATKGTADKLAEFFDPPAQIEPLPREQAVALISELLLDSGAPPDAKPFSLRVLSSPGKIPFPRPVSSPHNSKNS